MESGNQENGDQYLHIGNNAYRAVYKDGESQPYAVVEEDGYGIVYTTTGSGDSIQLGTKTELHRNASWTAAVYNAWKPVQKRENTPAISS